MTREVTLDENQIDILREVGNIGSGHAATALSSLVRGMVNMDVPEARLCAFQEIPEIVGGPEEVVAGVFLQMEGDLTGNLFILFSLDGATSLVESLLDRTVPLEDFGELEISALAEVGNILSAAYLRAVGDLCDFRLLPSVPEVAIDMAGAVLDIGIIMAGITARQAILIDTTIQHTSFNLGAHFFLLPDPASMAKLIQQLGGF